ncbi:MAG: cation diffusion facilitator family transporter [Planctomycetota bacterium]
MALIISITVAIATSILKFTAYWLTGSVGLLSDAAESIVNLVASFIAFISFRISCAPSDQSHPYGHEKFSYFSSGFEGSLILVAGVGIILASLERMTNPKPLEQLDFGMALCFLAALINAGTGMILVRMGKKHQLIILEANGKHLITDVWTSIAVLAGLLLVNLTGNPWPDPILAAIMGMLIIRIAYDLIYRSFQGLMDSSVQLEELNLIIKIINLNIDTISTYKKLRTRRSGNKVYVELVLCLPGNLSVSEAHSKSKRINQGLFKEFPNIETIIHIEPLEN